MEGSTQTCLFQLKIFQKTRKLSKMINLKQVKQKFVYFVTVLSFFMKLRLNFQMIVFIMIVFHNKWYSTAKDEKVRHGQLATKLFSILRHSVHPFCWTGWRGEGWTSYQIFEKRRTKKRGGSPFPGAREGGNFYIKNKLKSEICNDKNVYKQKIFSQSYLRI